MTTDKQPPQTEELEGNIKNISVCSRKLFCIMQNPSPVNELLEPKEKSPGCALEVIHSGNSAIDWTLL